MIRLLDIPDIRQRREYDCGSACVLAVSHYFRTARRIPSLANAVQGMSPETVAASLRAIGLDVLAGTMELSDLAHLTRTGRPVLCPTTGAKGGHWVIVRGAGRSVAKGRVWYHCPTLGRRSMPAADWLASWRDMSEAGAVFLRWGIAASLPDATEQARYAA